MQGAEAGIRVSGARLELASLATVLLEVLGVQQSLHERVPVQSPSAFRVILLERESFSW